MGRAPVLDAVGRPRTQRGGLSSMDITPHITMLLIAALWIYWRITERKK